MNFWYDVQGFTSILTTLSLFLLVAPAPLPFPPLNKTQELFPTIQAPAESHIPLQALLIPSG